jgi:hypothetical protein
MERVKLKIEIKGKEYSNRIMKEIKELKKKAII